MVHVQLPQQTDVLLCRQGGRQCRVTGGPGQAGRGHIGPPGQGSLLSILSVGEDVSSSIQQVRYTTCPPPPGDMSRVK